MYINGTHVYTRDVYMLYDICYIIMTAVGEAFSRTVLDHILVTNWLRP